jgi:phosphate/sulfate permease
MQQNTAPESSIGLNVVDVSTELAEFNADQEYLDQVVEADNVAGPLSAFQRVGNAAIAFAEGAISCGLTHYFLTSESMQTTEQRVVALGVVAGAAAFAIGCWNYGRSAITGHGTPAITVEWRK